MNKSKLITYVAIGLFISNLTLCGFIMFGPKRPPNHGGPKKIIAERLHFDTDQMVSYDNLIKGHLAEINRIDSLTRDIKMQFYATINALDTMLKDSLVNKLCQLQMEIENTNYNHFLSIKALCKNDQLPQFKLLVSDLVQIFPRNNMLPKK